VYCVELRKSSECVPRQHLVTGLITETECLLRGTDWIVIYNSA
jgi:hypothetical protein